MSYSTLMVHLDLDQNNDARLKVVGDLAERFTARVIGVAAQAEIMPIYSAGGAAALAAGLTARIIDTNLAEIKQRLQQVEDRFRTALKTRSTQLEWRSSIEDPVPYIAGQCRAADLLVIGKTANNERQQAIAQVSPNDLIGRVGRPLLIVPEHVAGFKAERILIAWKDTREAQRATFDALPLLKNSQRVIVCEVDEGHDSALAQSHVDDVVAWLASHGVNAGGTVEPLHGNPAVQLEARARLEDADLLIAGGFGHGRLREWILGGVTRDLLKQSSYCQLFSH